MNRAVALILTLALAILPAFAPVQPPADERAHPCCCAPVDETDAHCPLCAELRARTGTCPCAPAPQRQSGTTDQDRLTPAVSQPQIAKKNVRWTARVTVRPTLPAWIAAALRPAFPAGRFSDRAAPESPPLRAALCIWTT